MSSIFIQAQEFYVIEALASAKPALEALAKAQAAACLEKRPRVRLIPCARHWRADRGCFSPWARVHTGDEQSVELHSRNALKAFADASNRAIYQHDQIFLKLDERAGYIVHDF